MNDSALAIQRGIHRKNIERHGIISGDISPGSVLQSIHIAREILWTLRNRPIDYGNSSYLHDCLLSLGWVSRFVARWGEKLGGGGPAALKFAEELDALVRVPSKQHTKHLLGFADHRIAPYHTTFRAQMEYPAIPRGGLAERRYRQIVVVTGPGLGIGDEIIFAPFLWELARHSGTPREKIEIFSFSPDVWRALGSEGPIATLIGDPLAGYKRIEAIAAQAEEGETLALFANFTGQNMFRAYGPGEMGMDCLEISVGKGQAWLLRSDASRPASVVALDSGNPSLHLALDDLLAHLLGRRWKPATEPGGPRRTETDGPFRMLLNPFTSKVNPMEPEHWAELVDTVRAALPTNRPLHLTVHTGVTAGCHGFCETVAAACRRNGRDTDAVQRLTCPDGTALTPDNGIMATHRALEDMDFLLGMDTYTAHLATVLGVPSVALCLNYNPEFWELERSSFWWNIQSGMPSLHVLLRHVAEFMLDVPSYRTTGFRAACRALLAQGSPDRLNEDPMAPIMGRYADWYRLARTAWRIAPDELQNALEMVDAGSALPRLRDDIVNPAAARHRPAAARIANSNFFRLVCLASQEPATPSPQS